MNYTRFVMPNGLTVIHHPDDKTELVVLNILYNVGSKHETENRTGFAHLFEHLMFGGSVHVPDYDKPLQEAGGENNAFTSNDITNYYLTLPKQNVETGFWLESDRMLGLAFSDKSLAVQKGVVIEEFKERYLNQPYGDLWHNLLPLAYTTHPYRWPTIGKDISHIEQANMDDVKAFFNRYYVPNNAILVVAGNIDLETTSALCTKWFGSIPTGTQKHDILPSEPPQLEPRFKQLKADVPFDMLVKAYHTCPRMDKLYYATDLLSDYLGAGRSAALYNQFVKKEALFSEIDCYITGDTDSGLLIVEGKLLEGVSIELADSAVSNFMTSLSQHRLQQEVISRLKNKTETTIAYNDTRVLNRAMKLAYCDYLGDADLAFSESTHYNAVTAEQIQDVCARYLTVFNCSTIHYLTSHA